MEPLSLLTRYYRHILVVDFEFYAPSGERPTPLCIVVLDLCTGQGWRQWLQGTAPPCFPWPLDAETLVVTYFGSAEMGCFLALGWPFPVRHLDLYAEFRSCTSGWYLPEGSGLLGALAAYGLAGMASSTKEDMRQLAQRGGSYTATERDALLLYCASDVDALARLLPVMLPRLDLPRALLRGRYVCAVARMEWTGTPVEVETLTTLQIHWETIRSHLARTMNAHYGVFVPAAQPVLDPTSAFGAAVLRRAAVHEVNPYHLAVASTQVWRDLRALATEVHAARREARKRTGLTHARISGWERAGHDASTWPGLDDLASELARDLPALGLGVWEDTGYDPTDYASSLWAILRDHDERLPLRHDAAVLTRAAALVLADPTPEAWEGRLTFSAERFEHYLADHQIPWPRLPSGALALSDDVFREMAKAYPTEIGPLRELRHTLAELRLHKLAVGSDDRNRCLLSPFGARSGRNTPSNSAYVFGPSTWLRCLIQPAPGRAIAYVDWSQQELGIAAYFSGDSAMQAAYRSGDFYLTFAKMAGAAPPDATKDSHATIREQFKVLSLGILYGLSAYGLARRLHVPLWRGRALLDMHKQTFQQFWAWSDHVEIEGMLGGVLRTVFGWQMHVTSPANPRSVRNFPMQAHGAEMLRLACCLCTEHGIQVCAPVHDAVLIEARDEAIESIVAQTQGFMEEASRIVLPGFPLRTDAKIVRYPDRYQDPRGVKMWDVVQTILQERQEDVPF